MEGEGSSFDQLSNKLLENWKLRPTTTTKPTKLAF
jgi:hypothetical protein